MNKYFMLSIICFILGIISLGYGISEGQGKVYLLVIVPVIEGSGLYSIIGILLIIVGIFLLMFGFIGDSFEWVSEDEFESVLSPPRPGKGQQKGAASPYTSAHKYHERPQVGEHDPVSDKPKSRIKTGGVIFIGPIPIIWGSDKNIAYIMAIVSVVLVFIFLIFTLGFMF